MADQVNVAKHLIFVMLIVTYWNYDSYLRIR